MKKINLLVLLSTVLVIVALAIFPTGAVHAQDEVPPTDETQLGDVQPLLPPIENLTDFLTWLVGPGLIMAVGWFVSFLADKFAFWKKIPHDLKVLIPFLLAIGLVYVGTILPRQFPTLVQDKQLNLVFQSLLFYFTTQKQHERYDKLGR